MTISHSKFLAGNSISSVLSLLPPSLKYLDLSNNGLGGQIDGGTNDPPATNGLSQFSELGYIDFSGNFLVGGLPPLAHPDQTKKRVLQTLIIPVQYANFSGNLLTGTIPDTWGDLNFTMIDISNNKLEGLGDGKNLSQTYVTLNANGNCHFGGNVQQKICATLDPAAKFCGIDCLFYWCNSTICENIEEPVGIMNYIQVSHHCRHFLFCRHLSFCN